MTATAPQLDPSPRRLRGVAKWSAAAVVAVAVAIAVVVAAVLPRGATLSGSDMNAVYNSRIFSQHTVIHNPTAAETIVGVTARAPGVTLISGTLDVGDRRIPLTGHPIHALFAGHSDITIELAFRVTDCSRAPSGPIPVSLHLKRWLLIHTETVVDYGQDFPDAGKACGLYR